MVKYCWGTLTELISEILLGQWHGKIPDKTIGMKLDITRENYYFKSLKSSGTAKHRDKNSTVIEFRKIVFKPLLAV